MDDNTSQQTQVTPPASPVVPDPQLVPPGRKSKNKLIALIVLAVLLVAGMAYGAYAYVSNMPDTLLQSALDNLTKQKSWAAQYSITSDTNPSSTIKGDIAVMADNANSKNGEAIIGVGSGTDRVSLSALSLDGALYLRAMNAEGFSALMSGLAGADSGLNAAQFKSMLKNLDNQWFELSKSDIGSLAKNSGNDTVNGSVSPQDIQKVEDIYRQHQFIKPDKMFSDQTIDGKNCAHFSLKVDQQQEIAFMQAVKAANLATIKITDADIDQAKKNSPMQDATAEVWVARDSHTFKQAKFASTKKGDSSAMTITLAGALPAFDKFQKPANTRPFSDILTILLGSSMPASTQGVPTTLTPDQLNALQQMQQ